ncbi:protein DOG1-like 4 [Arachis duranensis]|uniref:Protein DOG1-like 4 n=1 Tax=Arachis duranensis TaxID=130453 RepID=A0A6P4CQV8_ARADU|nr:protein DOG1-like 4 [Arachis duranensis]
MSELPCPSYDMYHSQPSEYGTSESGSGTDSFHKFFEGWVVEQNQHLKELVASTTTELTDEKLQALIDGVVKHYEYYYEAKSKCAKHDVLAMLSPTWRSSLEDAFLWIGGWRPSMAFHLLYSKAGLQFEAKLDELLQGLRTSDLGDLSATQLAQIDEIQKRTIAEEREITDMMARHQETVADASMVELSHAVSEMLRANETDKGGKKEVEERVDSALMPKEEGLEEILQRADDLRLRTLQGIVNILRPKQCIHFLIAAAELHLRLHEWGKKRDTSRRLNEGTSSDEGTTHDLSTTSR